MSSISTESIKICVGESRIIRSTVFLNKNIVHYLSILKGEKKNRDKGYPLQPEKREKKTKKRKNENINQTSQSSPVQSQLHHFSPCPLYPETSSAGIENPYPSVRPSRSLGFFSTRIVTSNPSAPASPVRTRPCAAA
jgi:hypothetical protein